MTDLEKDIELVRTLCIHGVSYSGVPVEEAFNRILERTIPELPDGWVLHDISWMASKKLFSADVRHGVGKKSLVVLANGTSPRNAVLNAIKKIKGELT